MSPKLVSFIRTSASSETILKPAGASESVTSGAADSFVVGPHLLVGNDDVYRIPRLCINTIEKNFKACAAMDEVDDLQRPDRWIEIRSSQQNVDVLRISHRGNVNRSHPRGDRVSTGNCVRDSCRFESLCRPLQSIARVPR